MQQFRKIREHLIHSDLVEFLIRKIGYVVPKKENLILFYADGRYQDNPFYLYRAMKQSPILNEKYEMVWLVNDDYIKKQCMRHGVMAVSLKERFNALKLRLRAKYIVTSHGPPICKSSKQVIIDLWHGIPIKNLGLFLASHNEYDKKGYFRFKVKKEAYRIEKNTDYFIVPSRFVGVLFSSVFRIPPEKILVLGQPRCDALFEDKKTALRYLKSIIDPKLEFRRVILYTPTYRDYDPKMTSEITKNLATNERFIDYLRQNGLLLLILPHPFEYNLLKPFENQNVVVLDRKRFLENNIEIYDILPAVDILITDYSSIYFDYLLLNRPIIFYVPDLEKYRYERGFLLEPYEMWTPGDKAKTVEELILALDEAINNPKKWERERCWLRDVMFEYQDGNSSERIIKHFWGNK